MAKARIEYLNLGRGSQLDGHPAGVVAGIAGPPVAVTTSTTVTASGSRPTAPADCYARILAIGAAMIVSWGADPTASEAEGVRLENGTDLVVSIRKGQKLSFVEVV